MDWLWGIENRKEEEFHSLFDLGSWMDGPVKEKAMEDQVDCGAALDQVFICSILGLWFLLNV